MTFVAASGDQGLGTSWPAASPYVLGVGGTSLALNPDNTIAGEAAWSRSGGGVALFEPEPPYQLPLNLIYPGRPGPDVSLNADPRTGVAVYSSIADSGRSGWWRIGGTSAAAPQWAAIIAIADQGRAMMGLPSLDGATQALPTLAALPMMYYNDITLGSNGFPTTAGFDLVTGRGTPRGRWLVPALASSTLVMAPPIIPSGWFLGPTSVGHSALPTIRPFRSAEPAALGAGGAPGVDAAASFWAASFGAVAWR